MLDGISPQDSEGSDTAFFIFTCKYLDWMENDGGYEKYRVFRSDVALVYAKGVLERFPYLKRIIGISREPPDQGRGLSEDMIYAEQYEWSDEDRRIINENCEKYGVLQQDMKTSGWSDKEFPEIEYLSIGAKADSRFPRRMNRKQRRAHAAKRKRKR
jgi:hypothetical protein